MTAQSSNISTSYWTLKDISLIKSNIIEEETKHKVNELIHAIKNLLTDFTIDIETAFISLFDDILLLRFESINWINNQDLDISALLDQIYNNFIEKRNLPNEFHYLKENVLFVVRTTFKITKQIASNKKSIQIIQTLKNINNLPENYSPTPYKDLVNSSKLIAQQLPNNSLVELLELINYSLFAELGIIAVDIIFDNYQKLNISSDRLNELNELIVDAAQEYGALAIELGLIEQYKRKSSLIMDQIDDEDQFLAEIGLYDFFDNLEEDNE